MTNTLRPVSLRCEYKTNPLGIDAPVPRLFWTLDAAGRRDARQTAYQIVADEGALWDSGKVASSQSVHVPYGGPGLRSGQRVNWKVRVWDESDQVSDWSDAAFWQMGLLSPGDWSEQWISLPPVQHFLDLQPCPHLRGEFTADKAVKRATVYATARGVYALSVNGQRVGDAHFAPGWTDYGKRIAYQTYDVTALIQSGANALGVILGDGWYAGYVGFERKRANYGDPPEISGADDH